VLDGFNEKIEVVPKKFELFGDKVSAGANHPVN